jgi:hypothetical protein
MSNENEKIDAEWAARLKSDLENTLTPAARDYCREVLATLDKPKEEPAPDYSSLSDGEFAALKSKLIR